jgi:hypothetical protein
MIAGCGILRALAVVLLQWWSSRLALAMTLWRLPCVSIHVVVSSMLLCLHPSALLVVVSIIPLLVIPLVVAIVVILRIVVALVACVLLVLLGLLGLAVLRASLVVVLLLWSLRVVVVLLLVVCHGGCIGLQPQARPMVQLATW